MIRILKNYWNRKPVILLLIGCLINASTLSAQCLSVRKSGRVFQIKSKQGAIEIKNPENMLAADNKYATARSLASISIGGEIPSEEIEIKDFGFSIPEPAVICGVEVRVKRRADAFLGISIGSAGPRDNKVMLLKNGATTGLNTARQSFWGDNSTYSTYGASNGTWGTTLTTADVNSSNFGVSFSLSFAALINVSVLPSAEIDHIEMIVHYQPGPVLPVVVKDFKGSIKNDKVYLNWSIANMEPNTSVYVERSSETEDWININNQLLRTDLTTEQLYRYIDQPEHTAIYKYRLKIVSPSGIIKYSKEVLINWTSLSKNVFLVQRKNQLILKQTKAVNDIQLFSSTGAIVSAPMHRSLTSTIIDITNLPTGFYFLKAGNQVQKFLK